MRYALIIAGGAGTRLWPMSRADVPKQLVPFLEGKSLLQLAFDRFEGMIPADCRWVGAGRKHQQAILAALPGLASERFLGEPVGRDTLGAVGLGAAVLAANDPDAVVGVFTADHVIQPVADFQRIVAEGFALAEQSPNTLVTFGIAPTGPATGFGYLELGPPLRGSARVVRCFKEKPPQATAEEYFKQGPDHYLWNSGMFVWRAATLLNCIRRYEPAVYAGLTAIARAWHTSRRDEVLNGAFPALKKISVDFAVMEPASRDASVQVAAIPMPLAWRDVGSWPSFAETCPHDAQGNALAAARRVLVDCADCLVAAGDAEHLVAMIGCRGLIVIQTHNATLICPADQAERIKELCKMVGTQFGPQYI